MRHGTAPSCRIEYCLPTAISCGLGHASAVSRGFSSYCPCGITAMKCLRHPGSLTRTAKEHCCPLLCCLWGPARPHPNVAVLQSAPTPHNSPTTITHPLLCPFLHCPLPPQEVLVKGDKYGASIAWLSADTDTHSTPPNKPTPEATASTAYSSNTSQLQSTGSSDSSSMGVVSSDALQVEGSAGSSSSTAAAAAAAGVGSGPGQLPVSSARVASVVVQPDRYPGPSLSLQDFPQQGM
jgi:hypothetical protein